MHVARVEAEGDAPAGLLQDDALGLDRPRAGQGPLVEREAVGARVKPWPAPLAEVGLGRAQVVPVGRRLHALAPRRGRARARRRGALEDALGLLVAPLAEVLVADHALARRRSTAPASSGSRTRARSRSRCRPRRGSRSPLRDRAPHALDVVLERELRRVHAEDDQPVRPVRARPRADVRLLAQPVDARQRPEVDEDDVAAERRRAQRLAADPRRRAVERRHVHGVKMAACPSLPYCFCSPIASRGWWRERSRASGRRCSGGARRSSRSMNTACATSRLVRPSATWRQTRHSAAVSAARPGELDPCARRPGPDCSSAARARSASAVAPHSPASCIARRDASRPSAADGPAQRLAEVGERVRQVEAPRRSARAPRPPPQARRSRRSPSLVSQQGPQRAPSATATPPAGPGPAARRRVARPSPPPPVQPGPARRRPASGSATGCPAPPTVHRTTGGRRPPARRRPGRCAGARVR